MAKSNPRNPQNEPCKQMLLDAIDTAREKHLAPDKVKILEEALKVLNDNPLLSHGTNQRWYAHRVPDNSVQFIQTRPFNKCTQRFTALSAEEERLYSLLECMQDSITGCVMIKKSFIADLCNMSQIETRRIQKHLDKLADAGFIEWIFRPQRGSKSYGVIRVNPRLSWIGSNKRISDVALNIADTSKYEQTAAYAVIDGEKIRCGTLVHKEHKNMADAASIDHQGTVSPQSQSHNIT